MVSNWAKFCPWGVTSPAFSLSFFIHSLSSSLAAHTPSTILTGSRCRNRHQGTQGASRNYRGPQPRARPGPALLCRDALLLPTLPGRHKLLEHTEKCSAPVETKAGRSLDGACLVDHTTTAAWGPGPVPTHGHFWSSWSAPRVLTLDSRICRT